MDIRIDHELGAEAALQRLREKASEHDIDLDLAEGERKGTVAKKTPLGAVRASFEVHEDAVSVCVEQKPAFLPAETVKRAITDGLQGLLG